jgi:diphthine-ammonia ligase
MRVLAVWSGGKDVYTAYHMAIEQGHDVAYLLTFVFMEPYIFHSLPITELQSKALGVPQIKANIKDPTQDILKIIARLKKEEQVEAVVTGDIDSLTHKRMWTDICKSTGTKLLMPLWDRPRLSGNRYRVRVLNLEASTGMKAIINCVDLKYFSEEWLGRIFDAACIQEMKALVGPSGIGIDATGEFGEFHTTVLDAPLFKYSIEISKFRKKRQVVEFSSKGKLASRRNFLFMDIEESLLKEKNSQVRQT